MARGPIKRVADAIRDQDRQTADYGVREVEFADVRQVSPLLLELHDANIQLEEEDLILSQDFKVYDDATGLVVGDTVAVKQMRNGDFLVLDVFSNTTPVAPDDVPDATTTSKGVVQLAGDLTGTAASPQIAANAVGTTEIADDAVTAAKIATDAVGSAEIAANAVGSSEIATDAVDSAEIKAGAVGNSEIANDAVDTAQIKDGAVSRAKVQDDAKLPTGALTQYAGSSAPSGFLLCDGSAVSRTTYADLFAVVSTTYGVGNGSSTFNLPDLRGRVPVGIGTHTSVDALGENDGTSVGNRRPYHSHTISTDGSHSHTYNDNTAQNGTTNYRRDSTGVGFNNNTDTARTTGLDGSHTHTVGSTGGTTDAPSFIVLNYIIKT